MALYIILTDILLFHFEHLYLTEEYLINVFGNELHKRNTYFSPVALTVFINVCDIFMYISLNLYVKILY